MRRVLGSLALLIAVLPCALAAAQTAGRKVGDLYQPGEEAVWIFESGGKRIGEHWQRYEGPTSLLGLTAHHFSARTRLAPSGPLPVEQRYQAELWTDDSGRPLRHVLDAKAGVSTSRVEITVAARKAAVHLVQGGAVRDVEIDLPETVFLQANNFIGYFEVLLALAAPIDETVRTVDLVSTNVLRVIPYRFNRVDEFAEEIDGRTVKGVVLEDSFGETIHLSDAGRLIRLEVAAQKLVIRRSDEPVEAFEIEAPAPRRPDERFSSRDVAIVRGDVTIAGTVTKPKEAEGRLPAVFFISGSGLQDRNGFSSGVDTGTHEILDHLTAAGFLVLRVDDRGAGGSAGPMSNLGYDDLVADALACVDFLFEQDDVDPDRVALIGHSEGGITAPLLAATRPRIAAIVLMASTGRSLVDVIVDQNALALDAAGVAGEERAEMLAEVRRNLERVAGEGEIDPADLPEEFRALLANRKWLQDHARQDPVENLGRVQCPVLVLQGALDFQVSPEKDAAPLAAALDHAEHRDHELHVFPGLDHLFKKVEGEKSTLAEYFTERPVDAEFLETLATWLGDKLKPR
ncbi:MAG: alpha/beta fold hydrolase [Planctomycetes bacterium]|nr:alpha/beta fold hydrolase [Planctomycetota bacterium]